MSEVHIITAWTAFKGGMFGTIAVYLNKEEAVKECERLNNLPQGEWDKYHVDSVPFYATAAQLKTLLGIKS